jgi:hypothetical protein
MPKIDLDLLNDEEPVSIEEVRKAVNSLSATNQARDALLAIGQMQDIVRNTSVEAFVGEVEERLHRQNVELPSGIDGIAHDASEVENFRAVSDRIKELRVELPLPPPPPPQRLNRKDITVAIREATPEPEPDTRNRVRAYFEDRPLLMVLTGTAFGVVLTTIVNILVGI